MKFLTKLTAPLLMLTVAASAHAQPTFPPGFSESTVFSGLSGPAVVKFAPDGRIFVAEKRGMIKVFDDLGDTTPTIFKDLRASVYDYWDRGLLGMALDPDLAANPYVYVLYTLDKNPGVDGSPVPSWNDACPSPPGPTTYGCGALARLSRVPILAGSVGGAEQVLVESWCQQFPSHSIGALAFGPDGALYVSGGDGAGFTSADYGQLGEPSGNPPSPRNLCGDPPGGRGGAMTAPTAEGGALRSQSIDRLSPGATAVLNGAILRVDPATGTALADNPLFASRPGDPNAQRIVAYGLRNPFRFAFRPGTSEIWVGDVGWNDWEEIDRVSSPTAGVTNFGWPCYEGGFYNGAPGNFEQTGYDNTNLDICETLYATPGAAAAPPTAPHFSYAHSDPVVPGETGCSIGSSSVSGLAFYQPGGYPATYDGALFFTDYSRRCIWALRADGTGTPDANDRVAFGSALSGGAVDLEIGPGGDLYYVDYDGGRVQRVRYGNRAPVAVIAANPPSGHAPLTVQFDGSGSSDPDGDPITYAWDLDGDGQLDDSTLVNPSFTYDAPGSYTVQLRVTDPQGASDTRQLVVNADNDPPTATITTPLPTLTWKVGDVIGFSGSATDPQETLPDSAFSWTLVIHHCPSNCHTHTVQTFPGVRTGSFSAPDHDYPTYLELRLTVTDSGGLADTKSVDLLAQAVDLGFATQPPGLTLAVNASGEAAPFTRAVIVNSSNSVSAASPQTLGGVPYGFISWSDGGAQSHNLNAPASPTTFTATYRAFTDLSVSQSAAPDPVTVGGLLTYTATVTNNGPGEASNVSLADTLPSNVSFVSSNPPAPTCTAAGGTVTCGLGTIAAGGVGVVTLTVQAASTGTATNTASVGGLETDPALGNNATSRDVTIDPQPTIAVGDVTLVEGTDATSSALFPVSLSRTSSEVVSVGYATSDGTATAGVDYVARSGTLTFAPGTTARTLTVAVTGDRTHEPDETFDVTLSGAVNASIADGQATASLQDDDPLPLVSIGDARITEGNSGTTPEVLQVVLSEPSAFSVTVSFATSDGTARSGLDYTATSGTVSFSPGSTLQTLSVPIIGEARREGNEAFLVTLSGASGAVVDRARGQGVIMDDDRPHPDPCTPLVTVPIVLAAPGRYCLSRSLNVSMAFGAAIAIAADQVDLDLGGFTLTNTAGPGTQAYGVLANGRKSVTVRRGKIKGFLGGVLLAQAGPYTSPQRYTVESLVVDGATGVGIRVEGQGNRIASNQVVATGGTTLYGPDANAYGIVATGPGVQIARNLVHGTLGSGAGAAYAIAVIAADGARISRNRVSNAAPALATGVQIDGSAGAAVDTNRLTTLQYGIVFSGATGTYSGNVLWNVAVPYVGGTPGP